MKHSQAIKEGLLFYGSLDFMCHVLNNMASQVSSPVTDDQVEEIKRLIFDRINDKYTLNCYLRETDKEYKEEVEEGGGWAADYPHNARVEFWKTFAAELEAKGM